MTLRLTKPKVFPRDRGSEGIAFAPDLGIFVLHLESDSNNGLGGPFANETYLHVCSNAGTSVSGDVQ